MEEQESGYQQTPITKLYIFAKLLKRLPTTQHAPMLQRLSEKLRKQSANIRQKLQVLESILDELPDPVWGTAPDGGQCYYNAAWHDYCGKLDQADEKLDLEWLCIVHPDDRAICAEARAESLPERHQYQVEVRLRRSDREYRWHLLRVFGICDAKGQIKRWYGLCTDLEPQKRLVRDLIKERDQARLASQLKSEFVANISHELRTSLNGVLGMAEVLLRSDLDPKSREYVLLQRRAGRSLLAIINDVLDLSKIEAGKVEIDCYEFELTAVIQAISEILAPQAEEKGLELVTFVGANIPEIVLGDPLRLHQVLLNLGSNAVKFTEHGSICIRAEYIETEPKGARVKFSISDSGIGISEEQRKILFQPFTQADGSIVRKYGGTGLGLSICKSLVDLMGGKLIFEPNHPRGSVFSFDILFPTNAVPMEQTIDIRASSQLLLVRMRPLTAASIIEQATSCGLATTEVDSFEAALRLMRCLPVCPALVIVDVHDDKESCLEFGRQIRTSNNQGEISLVYVTTQEQLADFELSIDNVSEICLSRPVKRDALLTCLLRRKKRANAFIRTKETNAFPRLTDQVITSNFMRNKILVADDDKMNQVVARLLLTDMHAIVHVVDNGVEAVSAFKDHQYDLVFLDCQMPELDGYEASRIIKQIQRRRGTAIPVIAMTANALSGSRERCFEAGMDDYLSKPIDPEDLEKIVSQWLGTQKRRGSRKAVFIRSEEEQEEDTMPGELPLDYAQLASRFNEQVVKQLLEMFKASGPEQVSRLGTLLAKQHYEEAKALAHGLKGSCGTIFATELFNTCNQLEVAAGAADKQRCDSTFADLTGNLQATLKAIDERLRSLK